VIGANGLLREGGRPEAAVEGEFEIAGPNRDRLFAAGGDGDPDQRDDDRDGGHQSQGHSPAHRFSSCL